MTESRSSRDQLAGDYWRTVEMLVERASVGITPILVRNSWQLPKWEGVGSGFVLLEHGNAYLVTASHVLDCAFRYKEVVAKLFGKVVHLHGLYFASNQELDVSVTLLPREWLDSYGIDNMYAPSVVELPSIYERTGQYLLIGFPVSQNRMDLRWSTGPTTASWFISSPSSRVHSDIKIASALVFDYDPKKYRGNGRSPPALQGMSGGPVLELMTRRLGDSKTGLSLYPRGILCEWHKRQKIVVAATIDAALATIRDRSNLWRMTADIHGRSFPALEVVGPEGMSSH